MKKYIVLIGLLWCTLLKAQQQTDFSFTTPRVRDSVHTALSQMVDKTIQLPFKQNESAWSGACWAMELMLYQPKKLEQKIPALIGQLPQQAAQLQYQFVEMLYTVYPKQFAKEIKQQWYLMANPKSKAIALEYLKLNKIKPLITNLPDTLPPHLYAFLAQQDNTQLQLKQNDFLSYDFLPQQVVLCSFQHSNRNLPGYLMIRTAQHTWLSDSTGKPYRFPQLARSITNLPYYLTNGNTPQGLYRLHGWAQSDNKWIGPTTNLQMVMPMEVDAPAFFDSIPINPAKAYATLLSPALATYTNLWQSFRAAQLGRSEIIAHGTAIDPNLYKGKKYFPHTPSLGCLCSPEMWNGTLLKTVQQDWVNKVQSLTNAKGYLIVAEIADFNPQYGDCHW